jgi:hypothetical protein
MGWQHRTDMHARREEVRRRIKEGTTIRQIADEMGLTYSQVWTAASRSKTPIARERGPYLKRGVPGGLTDKEITEYRFLLSRAYRQRAALEALGRLDLLEPKPCG